MDLDTFTKETNTIKEVLNKSMKKIQSFESEISNFYYYHTKNYKARKKNTQESLAIFDKSLQNNEKMMKILRQKVNNLEELNKTYEDRINMLSYAESFILFSNSYPGCIEELEKCYEIRKSLQYYLEKFEKSLGLEITQINSATIFNFKHINPHSKNAHYVSISSDSSNFQLLECIPSISSIDSLITDLNHTNDLSRFIKRLRFEFKKLYF